MRSSPRRDGGRISQRKGPGSVAGGQPVTGHGGATRPGMGAGSGSGLKNSRGAWRRALRTQRGGRAAGRARHPRRPLLGRLRGLSLQAGAYFDCRCAHDEFGAADVVAGTPSWSCVLERKKAAAPRLTATSRRRKHQIEMRGSCGRESGFRGRCWAPFKVAGRRPAPRSDASATIHQDGAAQPGHGQE